MSDLARRFLSSLFIISHPLRFVKGFSKLFSSFFEPFFSTRLRCSGSCLSDLFIISHPVSFVKWFFKLFSSFFEPPAEAFLRCRLVDSPVIISPYPSLCQYLFVKFFGFFSGFFIFTYSAPHPLILTP